MSHITLEQSSRPVRKSDIVLDGMDVQVLKHLILTAYQGTKDHALFPSDTDAAPHMMQLYYHMATLSNNQKQGVYLRVTTTPCLATENFQAQTAHVLIAAMQIAHISKPHPAETAVEETGEIGLHLFKTQKVQTALVIPYNTTVDTPDPVTAVRCPKRDERLTANLIESIVKTQLKKLDIELNQKEKILQDVKKINYKKLLPMKPFDFGR